MGLNIPEAWLLYQQETGLAWGQNVRCAVWDTVREPFWGGNPVSKHGQMLWNGMVGDSNFLAENERNSILRIAPRLPTDEIIVLGSAVSAATPFGALAQALVDRGQHPPVQKKPQDGTARRVHQRMTELFD